MAVSMPFSNLSGGIVAVPQGPGLGIEIDREVLQKYCLPPPAHYYKKPEEIPHQRATRGMLPAPQSQKSTLSLYAHSAFERDRRQKRLARKIRVQIRENHRRRCGARLRCASGDMRRDHHVVALQKLRK